MKYHHLVLLCFAFVSIFYTKTVSADDKVNIFTKHGTEASDTIHYSPSSTIELRCNTSEAGTVTWEKGGKNVTELKELKDRYTVTPTGANSVLVISKLEESDVGNYSCVVTLPTGGAYRDTVTLATATSAKWGVKVPKNANVVEGEKLTIKCETRGELTLEWFYKNATKGDENFTRLTLTEERFKISSYYDEDQKMNVTNGQIKVAATNMGDRGEFMCLGEAEDGRTFNSTCSVRIKDKYAALWPFLGICAEVFVLCAIIFIYEKKRNKTELEESDTDQSPDQKNTPDHGKESNLRHRQ